MDDFFTEMTQGNNTKPQNHQEPIFADELIDSNNPGMHYEGGNFGDDDYFGASAGFNPNIQQPQQQPFEPPAFDPNSGDNFFDKQPSPTKVPMQQQQQQQQQPVVNFANINKTQEEIEEDERIRAFNQKKMREIEQKEDYEREEKLARKQKARQILDDWMNDWRNATEKRRQINYERQQEILKNRKEDYKSPWDKIVNNVAIKENDYPGGKDVGRFRQAMLNKKLDDPNGISLSQPQSQTQVQQSNDNRYSNTFGDDIQF